MAVPSAPCAAVCKRTDQQHHSSLYNRRLPKFEASRDYESYAREEQRIRPHRQTAAAAKRELSLEQKTDKCLETVGSQNSLREIFYKLLVFCSEKRPYGEVERFIQESDEYVYSHIIQSPVALIEVLVRSFGLVKTALDSEGNPVSTDLLAELDPDEADDIVCGYTLTTSEAGNAVADALAPRKRFKAQLARNRGRIETFIAILDFCAQEPRKFPVIKAFYDAHDEFEKDTAVDSQALACDFYVDKLEKAAMLVWRGQWEVTSEGRQMLAEYKTQSCLEE